MGHEVRCVDGDSAGGSVPVFTARVVGMIGFRWSPNSHILGNSGSLRVLVDLLDYSAYPLGYVLEPLITRSPLRDGLAIRRQRLEPWQRVPRASRRDARMIGITLVSPCHAFYALFISMS